MSRQYGLEPVQGRTFSLRRPEFLFVIYMPIKMPGSDIRLPDNLGVFQPLVHEVPVSCDDYLYITAKHMFLPSGGISNRPGWHCDGFGTEDTNWLWSDCVPTEFCVQPFTLSDDDAQSMVEMQRQAKDENIVTYPAGTLLGLDASVVHRPAISDTDCFRTFAKLSVSRDRYALEGNAHNYLFDYDWPLQERQVARNTPQPTKEKAKS